MVLQDSLTIAFGEFVAINRSVISPVHQEPSVIWWKRVWFYVLSHGLSHGLVAPMEKFMYHVDLDLIFVRKQAVVQVPLPVLPHKHR
jgi:hypothetical protein